MPIQPEPKYPKAAKCEKCGYAAGGLHWSSANGMWTCLNCHMTAYEKLTVDDFLKLFGGKVISATPTDMTPQELDAQHRTTRARIAERIMEKAAFLKAMPTDGEKH